MLFSLEKKKKEEIEVNAAQHGDPREIAVRT